MGYSISWLAIKGRDRDAVLESLGLRCSGDREDHPKSSIAGATLPGGWFLIVARRTNHQLIRDSALAPLSLGCEAVTLDVEEHVMFSKATGWKNGHRIRLSQNLEIIGHGLGGYSGGEMHEGIIEGTISLLLRCLPASRTTHSTSSDNANK